MKLLSLSHNIIKVIRFSCKILHYSFVTCLILTNNKHTNRISMRKKVFYVLGVSVLLLAMYSCSNELHITMPQGPQGSDGASAYEVWAQAVKDGIIGWDVDRIDINNYFLYLKGKDGQDGDNGKSAYELWLEEVAKGIANPHHPGEEWARDKIGMQDFWYFLTGAKGQDGSVPAIGANGNWYIDGNDTGVPAKGQDGHSAVVTIGANGNWFIDGKDTGVSAFGRDGNPGSNGKSAYELWAEAVANGIPNPHNPGDDWPKDKTSPSDFWYFLKGDDGKNADENKLEDDRIVIGKPNVLPQSIAPNYNEFVNPEDGSVRYRVYDKEGASAPGAKVKLPEISKEYTADADGYFIVEKGDLPDKKPNSKVAFVSYKGETNMASAENAEVSATMRVRIRLLNPPRLDETDAKSHIAFHPVVERSADGGTSWESIPDYLRGINSRHGIKAYECVDPENITYNSHIYASSILPTSYGTQIDVTQNNYMVRVNRFRKKEWYNASRTIADEWDGADHYFTLVVDGSYYGETLQLNAVTKMAPIQGMPFLKADKITATGWSSPLYSVRVDGEFDLSNVDPNLLFNPALKESVREAHSYYEPEIDTNDYKNSELIVSFIRTNYNVRPNPLPAVSNPTFFIQPVSVSNPAESVWINVSLTTNHHYFYSLNTIGRFRFAEGKEGDVNSLLITRTGTNAAYDYSDISVTYKP